LVSKIGDPAVVVFGIGDPAVVVFGLVIKQLGKSGICNSKVGAAEDTLQRKSYLFIPFLGIAWPQSKFPHSCVCEQFIYF
jgi:hypothetical protein